MVGTEEEIFERRAVQLTGSARRADAVQDRRAAARS